MKNSIFNAVCKMRYLALLVVLILTCGNALGDSFSTTYGYSDKGKTWTLTNCTDQSTYWQCPTEGDVSVATISGIFTGRTITSDVVITINNATYGTGTNPSATTFTIYNSSACTSQVTAAQSGTLATSKTYVNTIYTVTQANATNFTNDLAIKINKPGKTIRLKTIKVAFTYTDGGGGGASCSECTYYVYNGSTWKPIGTTGFEEVVLAPPTVPSNAHGAGNGCWVKDKTFFDGGCTRKINNNNNDYRFVPNPDGTPPDADNKPGSGTCELYAVYSDESGCLSTTVTAEPCARIWEEPEPNTPSVSGSDVTLSWSSVAGASGYHLYVTDYDSYEFDKIVDGTSKTLTGLTAGTYSWTVAANSPTNDACDSNSADGKDFEIVGCTDISGSTVTGVSVTPSKEGGSATWTAVANASSYEVKVYAGTATSGSALFSAEPTSNSCTITGLNASTQYTVVVKAKNSCFTSNQGKATWTTSALTLYTVTFVNQSGAAVSPATQLTEGGTVNIPSAEACDGWTFVGWKIGGSQSEVTSDPTGSGTWITSNSWPKSYTPTGNIDVYAVFKQTVGGGSGASVGTTLWAEDFSGYAGGAETRDNNATGTTVYSGSVTYATSSGTTIYDQNTAGGTAPEIMVAKGGGTFTITGIPKGGATSVTLTYTTNKKRLTVSVSGTGYSGSLDESTSGTHTRTITCGSASTFGITFTAPNANDNVRLDNIKVTVATAGASGTTTWRSDPPCCEKLDAVGGTWTTANNISIDGTNITVTVKAGNVVANASGYRFVLYNEAGTSEIAHKDVNSNIAPVSTTFTSSDGVTLATNYKVSVITLGDGSTYCDEGNESSKIAANVPSAATWTVTYNKNTTDEVTGMPASPLEVLQATGSGTLSDATPTRTGYTFGGWSNTSGSGNTADYSAGGSISGVTADKTIYAVWTAKPTYTITLNAGNGTISDGSWTAGVSPTWTQTQAHGDASITFPTASCNCAGWVFQGWKLGSAADDQSSFTPDQTEGSSLVPTGNVTYYAVYRQNSTGGTTYNKITDIGDLTTGTYVIKTSSYAMRNNENVIWNSTYYRMPESSKSGADASITNSDATLDWTIIKFGSNYAIKSGSKFVGIDGDGILVYDETMHLFTAAYDGTNNRWVFTSTENTSYQLVYNTYFRSLDTQNTAILLYKQGAGLSGNYYTNPVCSDYTVTGVANPAAGGSVTLSATSGKTGDKIYAYYTKDPAYNFENWSVSGTGATLSSTTDQYTELTIGTADVTLTANFAEKVMYSVSWVVNNAPYSTGTPSSSIEGGSKWSALTLPTAPADNTLSDCDRTKFVGWSTSQLFGDGNDAPADLFKTTSDANADSHTITGETTFYAVFAKGGGEGSWVVNGSNITVTGSGTGYAKYNGDHELSDIGYKTNQVMPSSNNLQFQASAGYLYNTTAMPSDITSIVLAVNTLNVYEGTAAITSTGELTPLSPTGSGPYTYTFSSGKRYFYLKEPDSGASVTTVTVNYEGTGTDYATQCCTLKPVTNLAVSSKTANSVTLTWTAPSPTTRIDHLELRNASTDEKIGSNIAVGTTTTTVGGLNECTTYSYKIVSVGAVCETPSNIVEATPFGGSKTVTFDYNGGTGTSASFTTSCGNLSTTLPAATRDGYTFLGWWTAADGGSKVGDAGANYDVATTTTIYAHWAQNFTVTYDLNDGAADPICSGGTYYVGQSVTVCSTTPTKTSSSFLGWKRLDTDATVAGGSTFTMPSNNVTIQAQWETVCFHIYYKEEDGTAIATDDVPQTAETTLRNQTPCVGYTFFGWSTSKITSETTTKPSIIGKGGASYTPDADITVYPVYARSEGATTVKDTLTVANTGVTNSYGLHDGLNKEKPGINSDAVYSIYAISSSGMQFKANGGDNSGLVTTTSGGKLQNIAVHIPYAASYLYHVYTYTSTTPYSQSEIPSTIHGSKTWDLNHSSKSPSGGRWYNHDYSSDDYETFGMYATATHRTDSIIVTWGTGTYYYATHCNTKENVTVTYNGNGGTVGCGSPADGAITSVTWDYKNSGADAPTLASAQTICASATRSGGYVLRDWTTGVDGTGTHYTPGASITSLANDITLYAQWDRVYTVTFNDQGATTSRTQASGGSTVAVPSNPTPCNTKPGVTWTFAGWGSQDGLAQSLNGHIVIPEGTSTYTPTDDITLYAVYRKSTGTSDAFAVGTSGAYTIGAKQGAEYAECLATVKSGTGYNCKNDGSEPATIFYLNYINLGEHIGQYTMQDGNTGEYVCYSGNSTGLSWSSTTPYYYNVVANGTGWNLQCSTATGRYFTHETGSTASSFKAYQSKNPVTLHPAAASTYYTVASCDDDFSITFHANGGTITWNMPLHGEGTYQHLADGTEIDVFPTATFDGWTFLGWQSANYDESTTVPEPSTIYGGSDGESGNHFTIHSNTDMYPIFTRFEENEPFDQINGGDYYIYFLESGSNDGYGAEQRVYAADYDGSKRYNSSALCSAATTFTFTKLGNGNWTIYDNTTKKYLYGVAGDALKQQASATGAEWTLTVNGNQFDAFHVGTSYGQITAFGNGESATFMNYSRTNIGSNASYHRVYLGGCTNRTFTTYPSTTPNIEIHGQVKVTSTADKSIKAASVLTVSATNIATANLTLTSDNSAFKFSLTSNGTYTESVNIPVVSNKVGVTPIYVEYTPTLTTDGIEEATITVSDGASPTPTTATTESGDVQGRHLPADFVIAAKIGNNWYALPADCSTSTSSTAGVLIEVDNPSNPTRATGAPMNTKYGLQPVRPSRVGSYGNRLVFTEHLSTQTTDNQKTLYNGAATSIQVNAMYANYIDTNPEQYEWIPTTTDLKDYTLTSAKTFDGDAAARTVSLNTSGVFGTLLLAKAYDGKVRLLPATFYEPAEVQILKWKTNSVIVMYTGADNATTKVGSNPASDPQALNSHKLTQGIYEFTTNQALTANAGQTLRITLGSSRLEVEIPLIIASNTTAAADGKDVVILDGATFTAAGTKRNYRNVYVYGGGKLDIPTNTSLGVNNIILRAGGVTTNGSGGNATYAYVYPQVKLVGTLTSTQTNIKYEYVTDYDHWYHLCLPFNALTSTIQYPQEYYGSNVAADNHGSWVIKRYDGATRATGNYDAWVDIESNGEPTPTTVTAGNGYIFWGAPKKVSVGGGAATRQAWGIQRITMAITAGDARTAENADKNVTDLAAHSSPAGGVNDQGWNLIGNPYMANLTGLEGTSLKTGKLIKEMVNGKWTGRWESNNDALRYITVPNNNFETYEAVEVAGSGMTLTAGKAFFVQLDGGANAVQFETSKRASLAPAWYRNTEAEQPVDVETGIVMSSETLADEVNFWIKDGKTEAYEFNADYPKTPNKTNFNIYGVHQSGNLSWVAISPAIAEGDMAIGYQVPAAGDYTLSLSEKYIAEEIESVFVTDHGVSPELTTDLMVNTYTFTVHQAETNNERFTVSIKVREKDNTPTDIGNSTVDTHAVKFIRDDKMYILRNGLLYDATGKRVTEINK